MSAPLLVACAHGTRDAGGRATIARLWLAARDLRPGLEIRPAYVDVQQPDLPRTLGRVAEGGRSAVVVPLLLSAGYHVHVDIAEAVAAAPGAVAAAALGPSPLLTDVLADRLREAGVGGDRATTVVLAAAGSSDARAADDVVRVAGDLAARVGLEVVPAYLSAARPTVPDAVAELVARGRLVAVASYLLAPGFFASRLDRLAREAGALAVTAPLGAHPAVSRLLLARYDEARLR